MIAVPRIEEVREPSAMKLSVLTNGLPILERGGATHDPEIVDVVYDSRCTVPGSLFVAVSGLTRDGTQFVDSALERGAVAVLAGSALPGCAVPWVRVDNPRSALGHAARRLWSNDAWEGVAVGVTGTNGKTTVSTLVHALLSHRYGSSRTWLYGTICSVTGGAVHPASHTTPEAADVLRAMGTAPAPPAALVMEVSSHALALHRVAGLCYTAAVWTNLTQDHLDFHNDMESYYQAKKRLFTEYLAKEGKAVVNVDDPWGARLAEELDAATVVTYGEQERADVRIVSWESTWEGSTLACAVGGSRVVRINSALVGGFNRYNLGAALATGVALGFEAGDLVQGLESAAAIAGRMERVPLDAPFQVVVDYAHTPDALRKVLATVRELTQGRVLCVFGCGGNRDRTKRALMGEAVANGADEAVVTSDNPRSENPRSILDDVVSGIPLDFVHRACPDRRSAIRYALEQARGGDCVVVAGKGHENYQEIQGERLPFDDVQVVRELYSGIARGEVSHAR